MLALSRGSLIINPLIYAELAVAVDTIEVLEQVMSDPDIERRPLPWEAAFLAGRCFVEYRRRGGTKRSPLPDFYIGSHAAVEGLDLLTRDPRRYRSYLPQLMIISP